MLQHLTRGFALRLHCTPPNCISTRWRIELVKMYKATELQALDRAVHFQRQYSCVAILMCDKWNRNMEESWYFFFLTLKTTCQISDSKVGHLIYLFIYRC